MTDYTIFYTAQAQVIIETIKHEGYSVVKKDYIQSKYGNTAKVFLTAYDWFIKTFQTQVLKPENAEYPIWLFQDPAYIDLYPDHTLLKLKIPNHAFIEFDNAGWERVLSMNYVGKSPADQATYDKKLENMGLDCGYRAFETPFYPHIRGEIVQSWTRIFNLNNKSIIRAAIWEIRKEWVDSPHLD